VIFHPCLLSKCSTLAGRILGEYVLYHVKMTDTIAWIIALAFYAPFHYLGPLLVTLLTGDDTDSQRKLLIINILIDCSLSMFVAFSVAFGLLRDDLQLAMLVLLISMCIPYLHIGIIRKFRMR
jgi:hypothetical protein